MKERIKGLSTLVPEKVIPEGLCCYDWVKHRYCPYFQFRKLSRRKWSEYVSKYPVPYGNKRAQYCSLLKTYLTIPDAIKDCMINEDLEDDELKENIEKNEDNIDGGENT